jgi:hypothetical protein
LGSRKKSKKKKSSDILKARRLSPRLLPFQPHTKEDTTASAHKTAMFAVAATTHPLAVAAAGASARRGTRRLTSRSSSSPRLPTRSSNCSRKYHTPGNNNDGTRTAAAAAAAAAGESVSVTAGMSSVVVGTWEQLEREVAEESVANVMRANVAVCHPDDSVLSALEVLVEQRLSGRAREGGGALAVWGEGGVCSVCLCLAGGGGL